MKIIKTTTGASWELLISGRIDGAAANELEIELLSLIKAGAKEIFLNLAQAEWICSAGIRVILQFYRQLKAQGRVLLVTRPSPGVSEILELTGFKDLVVEGAQPSAAR